MILLANRAFWLVMAVLMLVYGVYTVITNLHKNSDNGDSDEETPEWYENAKDDVYPEADENNEQQEG